MTVARGFFGGTDPLDLVSVIENGFATWIDTDGKDDEPITVHGAMVVHAPIDLVFDATTDFENTHKFIGISKRTKIHRREGNIVELTLRQGFGLPFMPVGLEERFRLRLERPDAVITEAYLHGSFKRANYDMYYVPLGPDRTLFVLSFISDLNALGWLTRFFLAYQPEIEFALAANLVLVPLTEMVAEAERRAGTRDIKKTVMSRHVHEAIREGRLAPALKHGYMTVGRLDRDGEIVDMTSVARIGVPRERLWAAATEPSVLSSILTFVTDGRTIVRDEKRLENEMHYRIKIGPFARRYVMTLRAHITPPEKLEVFSGDVGGAPFIQHDHLLEDGPNTIYCHMYHSDAKRDWLSRIFLKNHPEFERLIATYPSIIVVRALRQHLGGPK